jgi:predicted component of type VI protein secretion system
MDTMVSAPVSPVGARLRRPSWHDPKLLVGVLIVAAAVALGSWAVTAAEASTPVYVAAEALTPGEPLDADQVAVAQVRLERAEADHYLLASEPLPPDAVLVRAVSDGELLPRAAVAESADLDVRPVAVPVTEPPSAGVAEGALVDVWVTPEVQDGEHPVPRLLAEGLTVAEVARPSGAFAVGAETTVHVLVPTDSLGDVLGALATRQAVHVVLVPGTGQAP